MKQQTVIENLNVVKGFIRAAFKPDNAFAVAQGKLLAGMIDNALVEIKNQQKRINELEQYKAGWLSIINACNEAYPHWAPLSEADFQRVTDLIKSVAADPVGFHARDAILNGENEHFKRRYSKHGRRVFFIQEKGSPLIEARQVIATQALQALIIAGLNTDAWENYADLSASAYAIADEFLTAGKPSDPMQESYFSRQEINLFRQWFNAIEDTNRTFLNDVDSAAYLKILAFLEESAVKGGAQ